MLRFILSSLILMLLTGSVFAQEKETIRWLGWEQVPNFIPYGDYKGQGIGDSFTNALQQMLPQYNHETVITNTRRYNRLIREENICVAWAWIVPGSEDYRIHSRAVSVAPKTGIHILKSKQHLFGKPGETLSLAKLLLNQDITLGYLEEMSYTKKVHELMEKYRGESNIYFSSRSEVEFNLSMLDNNRLDYFFGFSAQAIFDAEVKDIPNKYQFYNIEEIDMFTSMHAHCSKTAFGEKVMAEINKIITQNLLLEHLEIVERWYGKNNNYREVFMDYVINQNPNKQVTHPEH
ncbi:MAG: hypothetical protein V7765_20300 [Oleispira sp.]